MKCNRDTTVMEGMPIEDIEFLMKTELLRATPDICKKQLINSMERVRINAGTRFIRQGEKGDGMYLIRDGTCLVILDKKGQSYPLSRMKAGDVVGEMATLTGENRQANVVAETEMLLLRVSPAAFEEICKDCPELQEFITNLATERLCSQKITADRTIGRYTINEIIAEGGWSIVYKGVHSFLNLPVAIKMLKHNMATDSDFFEKFQNEARTIACLNHENIVRVYDIEHLYKTVFIVMEYLDGVTLKQILEKNIRLPFPRILEILMQLCAALDYAHRQGIVHQDVKPGNIFIQKSDLVRIVDFGVACPIGVCSSDLPGTAFYMAPEQIESEPVDARTDIYSLGITAFEMATGHRPFSDDICEVLKAHITEPTPDPRHWNPELPGEFCDFLLKATQKDPDLRYDNMQQVAEELEQMARSLGGGIRTRTKQKRRMMGLFMIYGAENQLKMKTVLEEFGRKLEEMGAELKVADLDEI